MILFLTQLLQTYTYKLYELADDITAAAERRERARQRSQRLAVGELTFHATQVMSPEEIQFMIRRHRR